MLDNDVGVACEGSEREWSEADRVGGGEGERQKISAELRSAEKEGRGPTDDDPLSIGVLRRREVVGLSVDKVARDELSSESHSGQLSPLSSPLLVSSSAAPSSHSHY